MVAGWIKEIVDECVEGIPLQVGMIADHPDGRKVKIVAGQYWGTRGLSNFWEWVEVLDNGTLSEKREHGYGWRVKNVVNDSKEK